jgi:hypothetical protein
MEQDTRYWRDKWLESERKLEAFRDLFKEAVKMKGKKKKGKKGC